jgi:hypothetical protein
VQAHAIRVQADELGKLGGTGGPLELSQEREQPGSRGLRQHVVFAGGDWQIHCAEFCTVEL